jgi:hypothetical protein
MTAAPAGEQVPRSEGISTTELIDRVAVGRGARRGASCVRVSLWTPAPLTSPRAQARLAVRYEEHAIPSLRDPVAALACGQCGRVRVGRAAAPCCRSLPRSGVLRVSESGGEGG